MADHDESLHFGTVMPRAICVSGFFVGFAAPAVFLMLNQRGHADLINGRFHPDEFARRVLTVTLVGGAVCMLVGWLWWSVAASLNARRTAKWSVSPFYVPSTYAAVAVAALIGWKAEQWVGGRVAWVRAAALLFALVMYFATLTEYRRLAHAVGSSTRHFTRLIVVPWAAAAVAVVFVAVYRYLPSRGLLVGFLMAQLVQGVYGLTMYRAMDGVDRSTAGTRMTHHEGQDFTKFLKAAR
ncbi:MAG: hypothetical protein RLZ14_498 [Actinomycetota bacterium]|jgi:biotin transporter BioY